MSRAKVNFDLPTGIENLDTTVNFTSKPFPVISVEGYGTQAGLTAIRMTRPIKAGASEEYDVTMSLTGVLLKPSPMFTVEPEGYDLAMSLQGLRLKDSKITLEPEGYDTTLSLQGLKLQPQPKTAVEPEGYDPIVSLQGIELT